ncbi:hypothetical protein, partial [Nonomuraea deserti]|uniref:hypothetical protein n=1 Tax=Nonomuraea deserti TaxID=1848322 RepID=UPI001C7086A6
GEVEGHQGGENGEKAAAGQQVDAEKEESRGEEVGQAGEGVADDAGRARRDAARLLPRAEDVLVEAADGAWPIIGLAGRALAFRRRVRRSGRRTGTKRGRTARS